MRVRKVIASLQAVVIGAALLALTGCVSSARLYPVNDEAKVTGVLIAKYKNYGTGSGEITVILPTGETLTGEYSTTDNSSYGFGNIYGSVYGSGGYATGSASATSVNVAGSSPGVATLYGDKGTSMTCEYFVNNLSGHGAGACKASNGAVYRIHF